MINIVLKGYSDLKATMVQSQFQFNLRKYFFFHPLRPLRSLPNHCNSYLTNSIRSFPLFHLSLQTLEYFNLFIQKYLHICFPIFPNESTVVHLFLILMPFYFSIVVALLNSCQHLIVF